MQSVAVKRTKPGNTLNTRNCAIYCAILGENPFILDIKKTKEIIWAFSRHNKKPNIALTRVEGWVLLEHYTRVFAWLGM